MAKQHFLLNKSVEARLIELINALQIINDSLLSIRKGYHHYIIPLSGQLRALVAERSSKTQPLLIDLAKQFDTKLILYCMPTASEWQSKISAAISEAPVFISSGLLASSHRQDPRQKEVLIEDILKRDIIRLGKRTYSVREVIDFYANKAGGAHYAKKIPKDFSELLSLNTTIGHNFLVALLAEIGTAILTSGRELLKHLMDCEIHAIIGIPDSKTKRPKNSNVLFDAIFKKGLMRICLFLNNHLAPSLLIRGLSGAEIRLNADRIIDWSYPRHIYFIITLEKDLSTAIELVVDGDSIGKTSVPIPLFISTELGDYDYFHTRAYNGKEQHFSFAISWLFFWKKSFNYRERADLLKLIKDDIINRKQMPYRLFEPGSWSQHSSTSQEPIEHGTIRSVNACDLFPKDFWEKKEADNEN